MLDLLSESLRLPDITAIAITVFAIMDPPAAVPTLVAYVGSGAHSGAADLERAIVGIVNRASIAILLLLALFSLAGEYVLKLFNISLEALRIAGGLLLIVLAVEMLLGREKIGEVRGGDFAVVPIATPLIVGPGTMSTLIVYSRIYGPALTLLGALLAFVFTYLVLRYSYKALRYLGDSVLRGLGKFMSIIVASIAVELILGGLRGLNLL